MGIREDLAEKWKTPYFNQKLKSIAFNEVGLRGVKNTNSFRCHAQRGKNTLT